MKERTLSPLIITNYGEYPIIILINLIHSSISPTLWFFLSDLISAFMHMHVVRLKP